MKNRLLVVLIVLFTLAIASVFLYMERGAIYRQLDDWMLIPRPERFTELYFEHHTELPEMVVPGQMIPFSFTIHNLEGKMMEYPYRVYALSNTETRTEIEQKTLLVADSEFMTVDEMYTFPASATSAVIYIELIDKNQQLHFRLSNI